MNHDLPGERLQCMENFPHYYLSVEGSVWGGWVIYRSPVNSPPKGPVIPTFDIFFADSRKRSQHSSCLWHLIRIMYDMMDWFVTESNTKILPFLHIGNLVYDNDDIMIIRRRKIQDIRGLS